MFRNLQAWGYHVPPSVETECFPYFFTSSFINVSAIRIVLSKEIWISRITLSIESMAIQSHAYWLPTLSNVSSIINSDTFLLFWKIFLGVYRWIHFHIEKWFLLINCDNCCDVFLTERPEKYIVTRISYIWKVYCFFYY
jgi:hypothetical protein